MTTTIRILSALRFLSLFIVLLFTVAPFATTRGFVVLLPSSSSSSTSTSTSTSSSRTTTSLHAINALVKKSKEAELRKYVQDGIEPKVMEKYNLIAKAKKQRQEQEQEEGSIDESKNTVEPVSVPVGPLRRELIRRKGTITIIAEYKKKQDQTVDTGTGYIDIDEFHVPELLSPMFREYGASAIAVMTDPKMSGGCSYNDLATFVEEQRRAKNEVPGSVMIINNDIIIDELQIARTAAYGAVACVITMSLVKDNNMSELIELLHAANAVNVEIIVAVTNAKEAQMAIDMGVRLISIIQVDGADAKKEIYKDIVLPQSTTTSVDHNGDVCVDPGVCMIGHIIAKDDKQFNEIEEAWILRDYGFNTVWVCDVLYKSGGINDISEHPGAIIRSMKSKSSVQFASPKARSGRGEGAREYLGDILM